MGLLQAAPTNEYVDARKCAACHAQIAANYRQTGMSRSFYRPSAANTVEDYKTKNEFEHALSDTHYSMTVRDGTYYQRRWQIGFGGKETNVEESKIDYVIGSGTHARSYFHRMANGAFIELPLGWYQEKGGYWGMSPGFDSRHPPTRRFVSYECVFCHTAIPKIPAGHDAAGSDPTFTGDLPEGIDCQRCHGPGGNHVRLMQTAGPKPEEIRASIVNPARLSPKLQMDLCMQCHLEPTSGGIPSLIRRFNRGPFSFKPGEPLSNFLLAFDHAPGTGHDDKFEIVGSSAYRLRKSQCFLKSNGAMTCQTCHDPHSIPRGQAAVKYYAAACRQCHGAAFQAKVAAGAHTASEECATCHMPKRRTEDVVHVVMTDHLIQRRPPTRDLLAEMPERHPTEAEEYHGEVVPYYPKPLPATDENNLYRAVAQVTLKNNLADGTQELARETARVRPRESEFYMVLGDAWQSSGKPREAAAAYQQALRLRPDFPRGLLASGFRVEGGRRHCRARRKHSSERLRLLPRIRRRGFSMATVDYALGRIDAAIAKMEKAIAIDPELPGRAYRACRAAGGNGPAGSRPGRITRGAADRSRTMRPLTISRAECWPGKASCPRRFTLSKRPPDCVPAMHHICTTTRSRSLSAGRLDESQASVEAATAEPIRKWQKRTNCWAVFWPKAAVAGGGAGVPGGAAIASRLRPGASGPGQRTGGAGRYAGRDRASARGGKGSRSAGGAAGGRSAATVGEAIAQTV